MKKFNRKGKKINLRKLSFDELWKEAIENTFEDFMKFFFPQIAKHIDFKEKIIFRDKELIKIFEDLKDKKLSKEKRFVDALVEVSLKESEKKTRKNLFIHIEIQGYKESDFPKRMFLYYCLLYPKVKRDLISLCLFVVKDDEKYKPNKFTYSFEDFKLEFIYPAVNLYELKERALKYIEKGIKNIYADIVLLFFEEMEIEKRIKKGESVESIKEDFLLNYFKSFAKKLIEKRYAKRQVIVAFKFLDRLIFSKPKLEKDIKEKAKRLLEEEKMGLIMDIFEEYRLKGLQEGLKRGLEKGLKQGFEKGLKEAAKRMYRKGFEIEDIADTVGVDVDTVRSWLKEEKLL